MNSLHKKGFTLIELLVVITIIGVLATVIIASLSDAREKARLAKTTATFQEIKKALVLTLIEEEKSSWWTESELAFGNPSFTSLYSRTTGHMSTLSEFLPEIPELPYGGSNYGYDFDGDTHTDCSYAAGVNIIIYGTTLEERRAIDLYIDGEIGSGCGLVTYTTGESDALIFHMFMNATDF